MQSAFRGFLGRRFSGADSGSAGLSRAELARVRDLAASVLALADDVVVKVNEINCLDPACPGQETVILIMAPGERTRALKIRAPVEDVDAAAISFAAAQAEEAQG